MMVIRPHYVLVVLLMGTTLFSCASAKKRFEQGVDLEQEGRYVEAARRYIQSLEKDPDQPDARSRLEGLAPDVVSTLIGDAEALLDEASSVEAADLLFELDDLASRSANVGVPFTLPEDYDTFRSRTLAKAVAALEAAGRRAEDEQDWPVAVNWYDRIADYEPTSEQLERAEEFAIRSLLEWARMDVRNGHFGAALERTDVIIERLGGPNAPGAREALEIRDRAIELGTVFVAFTPIWEAADSDEDVATDFLEELNDFLEIEFWSRPPVLVAPVDPTILRRELRRLGYNRSSISPSEATRIGRRVDADLVVTGEVTRLFVEERNVRERTRSARTRDGETVSYTQVNGTLRYEAEIELELVDTSSRRVLERGRVRESESGRFERSEYDGNYRDLELSRNERRSFDPDRWRDQELEIEDNLIEQLAEGIAEEVYEDILRRLR